MMPILIVKRLGQLDREATFFSRSSKSLRSTFDLRKSSRMRSSCLSITGISSRYGLNSLRMDSMSAPTSVKLNLPFFLACFFMDNMVMQRKFFVKQKGCHGFYKKAEN